MNKDPARTKIPNLKIKGNLLHNRVILEDKF